MNERTKRTHGHGEQTGGSHRGGWGLGDTGERHEVQTVSHETVTRTRSPAQATEAVTGWSLVWCQVGPGTVGGDAV